MCRGPLRRLSTPSTTPTSSTSPRRRTCAAGSATRWRATRKCVTSSRQERCWIKQCTSSPQRRTLDASAGNCTYLSHSWVQFYVSWSLFALQYLLTEPHTSKVRLVLLALTPPLLPPFLCIHTHTSIVLAQKRLRIDLLRPDIMMLAH